jgi:osmoprotectant transport system permease protein
MDGPAARSTSQPSIVALTGGVLGAAAVFAPSFLIFRANRVVDGEARSAFEALGAWAWVLIGLFACAAAVSVVRLPERTRGFAVAALGAAAGLCALWRGGAAGAEYAASVGEVARMSMGPAFWVLLLAAYVVVYAATAWLGSGWERALAALVPLAALAALLASGALADYSVMREYAVNQAEFAMQLRRHLGYVLGATALGLAIGLPVGILAARRAAAEPIVFGTLNVLNVLPVLAFIGLLNPILTSASTTWPALAAIGVRGVGWAPIIIVLTAYAAYPIARNSYTAIVTLDPAVLDAAAGVGMGRATRLLEVELPLAAPVIIAGVRIALIQTTTGAIIAGLVGGGGLGSFVFLGASQTAIDLILMGTIPIVALGLFFDRSALMVQRLFGRWGAVA